MKLPYSWLKEYVDTKYSAEEIAEKLTMAGLEVEEIIESQIFSGVVIGEVISKERHPDADKLNVAKVRVTPTRHSLEKGNPGRITNERDPRLRKDDTEGDGILQIVCGAANLAVGQRVPVALVGAKLGDFEIGKAKLRGVESNGMICSERELGISDKHEGIMVLENDAPIGADFGTYLGAEKIIDIKVLANRPDCMSVIGLAREVAALTGEKLKLPAVKFPTVAEKSGIEIKVLEQKLCPRYMGQAVYLVSRNATPDWMKERLLASGVRSIDLLVDISNYVMLEYGQPLHFFDLDLLSDKQIVVRSAKAGEKIKTLDGVERKLDSTNLVIANSKEAIAIAGVMGGATTEINAKTKNIYIEAAVFDKASVRRTSRSLGLRSEAVARFEKGIGFATPEAAIARAAQLLAELAGGKVAAETTDITAGTEKVVKISLSATKLNKFLGTNYSVKQVDAVLTSLGFTLTKKGSEYLVSVPVWRVDIAEAVDLYEEVVRVIGYATVPSTLPFTVPVLPKKNEFHEFLQQVRSKLAGMGLTEIMTYSFAAEKEITITGDETNEAFQVANPLVKEQKYLRTSLLPKMLESLAANQYHRDSMHLFEIGKTFQKNNGKLPLEKTWLSIGVVGGSSWPYGYKDGQCFFDAKGAVDSLLKSFGISETKVSSELGHISEIKPEVALAAGLKRPVAVAILNLEKLTAMRPKSRIYAEISKFQKVERDITVLIPDSLPAGNLTDALVDPLIKEVKIVDFYEGKGLAANERAITIRLTIISDDHTLTDIEVEKVVTICQNKINKLGGVIRGAKE